MIQSSFCQRKFLLRPETQDFSKNFGFLSRTHYSTVKTTIFVLETYDLSGTNLGKHQSFAWLCISYIKCCIYI